MPAHKKIIILEDDERHRAVLLEAIQLAQKTLSLTIMGDCNKLLQELGSQPADMLPALLVLNHDMQCREVPELIRQMRTYELCKEIAFVVYTSKPLQMVSSQYQELNALAVFKKETNSQKLVEQINFICQFTQDAPEESGNI